MKQKVLLFIIGLLGSARLFAQVGGIGDETIDEIPFDGGIVTVTLVAAAYGVKRRRDKKDDL